MLRHYAAVDESSRIKRGLAQLELLRTQELVRRFLPPGTLDIADIGGGAGVHAEWLAEDRHRVHLIDPVPGHVATARALSPKAGSIDAQIGDARFLPFKDSAIDRVFSYSVLQHFSRDDVALVISEVGRVLKDKGTAFIQMPTKFGLRCLYHQARRGFREGVGFEVRYWTLPSLAALFASKIGTTEFSVDCFFGIGLQFSDLHLMPPGLKMIVSASEGLRLASTVFTPLVWAADSVYVSSVKTR